MKQTMDKERWKGWLISFFMETLGGFLVAVDPASFMVVLESNEVHGEGFRYIQMGD